MSDKKVPQSPQLVTRPTPPRTFRPPKSLSPYFVGGLAWPNIPRSRDIQAMALQVEFAMSEWWPSEKIEEYQLAQAQALINHAHKTVPYYKDILAPLAGRNLGCLTMSEFREIPLLNRGLIQDNKDSLVTLDLPKGHGSMFDVKTSGSSGKPLEAKGTSVTGTMYLAQTIRGHIWHKRDTSLKNITIRGRKGDQRIVRSRGWHSTSTGETILMDKTFPPKEMLAFLQEENPYYLQCFPSTLMELLRVSKLENIRLTNLREIRTISEVLEPALIRQAESQWGVKVTNIYSAMEINIIALTCPDNPEYMHTMGESVLLEVLDDEGIACPPGTSGNGVITTLANYGSPLIRYEFGDQIIMGDKCNCGRGLPTISRVAGRMFNLMKLPDGSKVSPDIPRSDGFFALPIKQFQVVQKSMEEVEIVIVADGKLSDDEEVGLIKLYLDEGYPFNFTIKYVDEIPCLPSGKYDLFRCEVDT